MPAVETWLPGGEDIGWDVEVVGGGELTGLATGIVVKDAVGVVSELVAGITSLVVDWSGAVVESTLRNVDVVEVSLDDDLEGAVVTVRDVTTAVDGVATVGVLVTRLVLLLEELEDGELIGTLGDDGVALLDTEVRGARMLLNTLPIGFSMSAMPSSAG